MVENERTLCMQLTNVLEAPKPDRRLLLGHRHEQLVVRHPALAREMVANEVTSLWRKKLLYL